MLFRELELVATGEVSGSKREKVGEAIERAAWETVSVEQYKSRINVYHPLPCKCCEFARPGSDIWRHKRRDKLKFVYYSKFIYFSWFAKYYECFILAETLRI